MENRYFQLVAAGPSHLSYLSSGGAIIVMADFFVVRESFIRAMTSSAFMLQSSVGICFSDLFLSPWQLDIKSGREQSGLTMMRLIPWPVLFLLLLFCQILVSFQSTPLKTHSTSTHIDSNETTLASSSDSLSSSSSGSSTSCSWHVLDFHSDFHGIPNDPSPVVCEYNTELLNTILEYNATNHTILFPFNYTFYFHHPTAFTDGHGNNNFTTEQEPTRGIIGRHVYNSILCIDGTLRFERPVAPKNHRRYNFVELVGPPPSIYFENSYNITITSSTRGLLDGQGSQYWGVPLVGYLQTAENRPRFLRFNDSQHIVIENLMVQDAPYHTIYLTAVDHAIIRNVSIVSRRTNTTTEDVVRGISGAHDLIELSAFNSDGIDVSGTNIHVHDVDIWNQDDCVTITDNWSQRQNYTSKNLMFENINCSGVGFSIGSIGGSTVQNVTFRNSYLYKSIKGIYLKFHVAEPEYWSGVPDAHGIIEDVVFENIVMEDIVQWPIWIGPAQQADTRNPCHANPCSLCWPLLPESMAKCNVVPRSKFRNMTLRNVRIHYSDPDGKASSPGVILSDNTTPMESVVFDNVRVVLMTNKTVGGSKRINTVKDLVDTFPGLQLPVNDVYVKPVSLSNLLRIIFRVYGSGWLSQSRQERLYQWILTSRIMQNHWKWHAFRHATPAIGLAWTWSVSSTGGRSAHPEYFRCQGVSNGVAMGDTWPVPSCFEKV